MRNIKEKIQTKIALVKHFCAKNSQWVGIAVLLVLGIIVSAGGSEESPPQPVESADTFIPAGFVLLPIDVVNRSSLESLLGSYGVVDLYIPSENSTRGQKVASRVKIMRAPLKPDEFAVLIRESEASQLIQGEGGYFVVIQNPNQHGTRLVKPEVRRSRITFEDG